MAIYGYCRVSQPKQKIQRQIDNIRAVYPDAILFCEIHTRTSFEGRKVWQQLMRKVKEGDIIVFDSVSRLSGSEEGYTVYKDLLGKGVDLEFLWEPHINTLKYKQALQPAIALTGTLIDPIIRGVNEVILSLAEADIKLAFEQSAKEVADLRERTRQGVAKARENGKVLGRPAGRTYETKKSIVCKKSMRQHCREFGGSLTDAQCRKMLGISKEAYYKYKKQIREEILKDLGAVTG